MDKYEKCAAGLMKLGDSIIAEKKRRRSLILRRTADLTFGIAAVIVIGVSTRILRTPEKPAPSGSGIIIETSTVTAAVTTEPSSESTKTVTSTVRTTTSSAVNTTDAARITQQSSSLSTTAATAASHTSAATSASAAYTTAVTASTATTAVTSTATGSRTSTTPAQITTVPAVSTTQTNYLTTAYISPYFSHTTTAYSGNHVYKLNYITIGTETTVFMKTGVECPSDIVGGKREDTSITGVGGERNHTENVGIYTIDGVSDNYAVVVFYPSTFDCPVYINTEYEPDTLGDMLDDMGLEKHMSFGSQNVKVSGENAYYDVSAERIMKVLGDCRDAVNTKEGIAPFSRDLTIFPDITYMRYNTNIYISKEGYITTKMIDRGASFYIGEEKALSCIEYLLGT
ncbi:hypothetical protein SAMN02910353_00024 [Ruminococcus sp. YRD2003]|uniref:hypothetical protein n=1 Tax=Ruminococcus sp. YRD2003 TaxID=1452313 RepID=UPI0008D551B9|nr:hypothetical protein SAMN02910353_00024 [Ruminococcus flavefaciens]